MSAQPLPIAEPADEAKTPKLAQWLLIGVVITMVYQNTIVFPALRSGYIVDLFMLALIGVGWLIIYWERVPLRFPFMWPHALIVIGSLLGSIAGLDRTEALSTLINDMYVWVFFYTAVNLIRDREFIHTLIKVWVVVAVLESCVIIYAAKFTEGKRAGVGAEVSSALQQVDATSPIQVPSLDQLPSEYTQAKHVVKRLQGTAASYGTFFQPGTGLGTFANGDFTANYTAASIFLALVAPFKRWRWRLRLLAAVIILYGCLLTGVSSQVPVIPVAFGLLLYLRGTPRLRLFYVVSGALAAGLAVFVYVAPSYLAGVDVLSLTGEAESQTLTGGIAGISSGVEDRLSLVTDGWREFRNHPLGLGPHGMRASGVEKNVHNEYVSYLYERGFLGLFGLLLMHFTAVALALASLRTGNAVHREIMIGLLAAYCMVAINDIAHELLRQRDVWMLFVLVVSYADLELRRAWAGRQARLASQFPWAYPQLASTTAASAGAVGSA